MAPATQSSSGDDAAILIRLIRPEINDLPVEAAETFLAMRFEQPDLDRIHELAQKNQNEALSPDEKADFESYLRVSAFLDLMHAKARHSLKKHS